MLEKSTYYILDAQGNQLSMYEHEVDQQAVNYTLAERNIYGSSRLGRNGHKVDLYTADLENPVNSVLGEKYYELSNHLGNVLAVINDVKYPIASGTTVDYFEVALISVSDYSPFGVQLDGRTHQSSEYRYGFQGQEKDDEVKGEGNSINYKYRMHDPRVGRFFAVDPLASDYPHNSPYAFSENVVINAVELEGLEKKDVYNSSFNGAEEIQVNNSDMAGKHVFDKNSSKSFRQWSRDKINVDDSYSTSSGVSYGPSSILSTYSTVSTVQQQVNAEITSVYKQTQKGRLKSGQITVTITTTITTAEIVAEKVKADKNAGVVEKGIVFVLSEFHIYKLDNITKTTTTSVEVYDVFEANLSRPNWNELKLNSISESEKTERLNNLQDINPQLRERSKKTIEKQKRKDEFGTLKNIDDAIPRGN